MFSLFRRKPQTILSPADGEVVDITEVDDSVFASKMVGDGVALKPTRGRFCAPISGVVSKIFHTNHAYSIKNKHGLEVMVHIGLDTVALAGKGFESVVEEGMEVEAGETIIIVDLDYLASHAKSTITPVVISDTSKVKIITKKCSSLKQGDPLMEVR